MSGNVRLEPGDCREVIRTLADSCIDSCVTDPPYALVSIAKRFGKAGAAPAKGGVYQRASAGFMGQQWDTGETAFAVEFWAEVYRVLKPGAHVVAFSGTRTYHRMACAIEDAGFEIRDQLAWVYGSGFPKSHDVSKGLDKLAGHWRGKAGAVTIAEQVAKGTEYERTDKGVPITAAAAGWGTALKPAWEPIVLARKPLIGTVVGNWLQHGTGAVNIDACRIKFASNEDQAAAAAAAAAAQRLCHDEPGKVYGGLGKTGFNNPRASLAPYLAKMDQGRWPANILHDGSEEVLAAFPDSIGQRAAVGPKNGAKPSVRVFGDYGPREQFEPRGDGGSAARFFYTAKADADDRWGSKHPTVKPVDLIRWLARLVTPLGGTLLDPFAGSGTTGVAALAEGFDAILIEREPEYQADIRERLAFYAGDGRHSMSSKNRKAKPAGTTPLLDAMGAAE